MSFPHIGRLHRNILFLNHLSKLALRHFLFRTVDDLSIATQEEAEDSLDLIDNALDVLASARAKIGAIQNRLESAASVSASSIESLSQARSQLVDTDVADETAEFAKTEILQQGTLAVLTNANLSSRLVLKLLRF